MKKIKITDKNGIDYLFKKPLEGQICQTKTIGGGGYNGKVKYTNGNFETYVYCSNRLEITRWRVDLWLPF